MKLKIIFFLLFLSCNPSTNKEEAAKNYRNCIFSLLVFNNNPNNILPLTFYCSLNYREERIESGE